MSDPTKIGIIYYLEERIKDLEKQIKAKQGILDRACCSNQISIFLDIKDLKIRKQTLESIKEWIKK